MKNLFLLLIICCSGPCTAQEDIPLDTLYANDHYNTALFFPSQVTRGIVGGPNFTFSYNIDIPQHLGLLKASPGKDSNLLVLTNDGKVYSYILSYRKELPVFNYFISLKESIVTQAPRKDSLPGIPLAEREKLSRDRERVKRKESYYRSLSSFYLESAGGNLETERENGIKLTMEKMIYFRSEVFLVLTLENKSKIRFELEYLNLYLISGNKKKNASFQKILKEEVFEFQVPNKILPGQRRRFVLVYPKFTLGDNGKIVIELREKYGNRFLKMSINNH